MVLRLHLRLPPMFLRPSSVTPLAISIKIVSFHFKTTNNLRPFFLAEWVDLKCKDHCTLGCQFCGQEINLFASATGNRLANQHDHCTHMVTGTCTRCTESALLFLSDRSVSVSCCPASFNSSSVRLSLTGADSWPLETHVITTYR